MQTTNRYLIVALATALGACGNAADDHTVVGELASDRIELVAEFSEPIVEVAVAEGADVSAGQVLVRLDDSRATARLSEAEAAAAQARARLDELLRGPRPELISQARANLDGADKELAFRQTEYQRASDLHARKQASADTLDRAQAQLDAAEANRKLRRAQLQELLAGTTVEELAQAEQALQQAQARRDSAAIDLERHTLRAPVDGIFDSRLFEPGEHPAAGQPVAILLGGAQPYARVYVPEHLRVHVKPGLAARIHVDGLAAPVAGRVRWVSSDAAFTPYFALTERDRGRLSYLCKVDIDEPLERLPDGIPVEVELMIADGGQ